MTLNFVLLQAQQQSPWPTLVIMLLIMVSFWLFFIRPQSKKAKDQQKFVNDLQKGDKIVSVAGMHGRINRVNENGTVEVEINSNTKIIMERSGISMEYTKALQSNAQAPAKKD